MEYNPYIGTKGGRVPIREGSVIIYYCIFRKKIITVINVSNFWKGTATTYSLSGDSLTFSGDSPALRLTIPKLNAWNIAPLLVTKFQAFNFDTAGLIEQGIPCKTEGIPNTCDNDFRLPF